MDGRFESIVFYLLVAIIVFYFSSNVQIHRREKSSLICIIAILTLIAGFRSLSVGVDTNGYYSLISQLRNGYIPKLNNITEQGFILLSYVLMRISNGYTLAFCVYALITNLLIILRLRDYCGDISFSGAVLIYYMIYYFTTFNTVRQWIAMAIVFYFSRYLGTGKKGVLKFVISVFIATTMHSTAVLAVTYIPIFYLSKPSENKRIATFKLFLTVAFFFVTTYLYDYFVSKYGTIYISDSAYGSISLVNLLRLVFFIGIILYDCRGIIILNNYQEDENKPDSRKFEMLLYFIGICLTMLVYFYRYADRIGQYYILFETIVLGYFIKNRRTRAFAILFTILLCVYLRYNSFMSSGYGEIPYIPFWIE